MRATTINSIYYTPIVALIIAFLYTQRKRAWLLLFACCLYIFWNWNYGINVMDEGYFLYAGELTKEGQIPYVDFPFIYGPGNCYLVAFLYEVFGVSIMTLRLFTKCVDCLLILTFFYFSKDMYCTVILAFFMRYLNNYIPMNSLVMLFIMGSFYLNRMSCIFGCALFRPEFAVATWIGKRMGKHDD